MSNDLVVREQNAVTLADPGVLQQALQLANAMATAKTLPAHLQGSPGDCLRVVELAFRTRQSPYAIADKTYLVSGKLAMEGQLCAALINAHPMVEQRLNYDYEGGDSKSNEHLTCTVTAKLRGEPVRSVKVDWKTGYAQAKGAKDKWVSQPEQQLSYYGARVWGRRHAPEILLGIYAPEEVVEGEMRDVTPAHDPQTGEVREERPARDPMESYEAPPKQERRAEPEAPAKVRVQLGPQDFVTVPPDDAFEELKAALLENRDNRKALDNLSLKNVAALAAMTKAQRDEIERIYNGAVNQLEQDTLV